MRFFTFFFLLVPLLLTAQEKTGFSGFVQNISGEPLAGVSITAKNTRTGLVSSTQSDKSGRFQFPDLPPGGSYNLIFSYVGYKPKELPRYVPGADPTPLSIQLEEAFSSLDNVVIVGYGTQRRKEITGAVSSVRSADLKDKPVTSFEQALAGRLPGVQVLQNTGAPGGSISIRIRGLNSISAGTDPLYVVDGFPVSNDLKTLQGSTDVVNITGQASFQKSPDPLSTLNTDDVESIEVLKDASAAAIYGYQAANGVIIITTKHGKAGHSSVSYDGYYGTQQVTRKIPVLNASQFAKIENLVAQAVAFFQQPEFAEVNVFGKKELLSRNFFFGSSIGKKFFVKNGMLFQPEVVERRGEQPDVNVSVFQGRDDIVGDQFANRCFQQGVFLYKRF